jgi:hypothetical protein
MHAPPLGGFFLFWPFLKKLRDFFESHHEVVTLFTLMWHMWQTCGPLPMWCHVSPVTPKCLARLTAYSPCATWPSVTPELTAWLSRTKRVGTTEVDLNRRHLLSLFFPLFSQRRRRSTPPSSSSAPAAVVRPPFLIPRCPLWLHSLSNRVDLYFTHRME